MTDNTIATPMSKAFLVWFKDEKEGQQAAAMLGAVEGVVSVGLIEERIAEQARNTQARAASSQPRNG